jgi:membrane-associated PAP2 superfamily phosphatase
VLITTQGKLLRKVKFLVHCFWPCTIHYLHHQTFARTNITRVGSFVTISKALNREPISSLALHQLIKVLAMQLIALAALTHHRPRGPRSSSRRIILMFIAIAGGTLILSLLIPLIMTL